MAEPDPIIDERPLAGRRIALVEHRELDRLGRMLEEQGAETLRCPLVAIADAPDQAAVQAWLKREIGLGPGLRAATPTTDGIIAALSGEDLAGRRVGVQLPPDTPPRICDFLRQAGALPDPIVPYAHVPRADSREIATLIEEMRQGRVDAIAFTS